MKLDEESRRTLQQLETSLWHEATRFDRAYMESILADDFTEVGASGRQYRREDTLAVARQPLAAQLSNFVITTLAPDVALVRYESEDTLTGKTRRAHRSSIWSRGPNGNWVLHFHQGTLRCDE